MRRAPPCRSASSRCGTRAAGATPSAPRAGCDPQDTSGLYSEGLSALANVTSHEWSETRTDPRGAGWFDSSGAENGDKCAWAFEGPVKLTNGSVWKLQMEWSNAAYNAGTGFPNRSGQLGCLQGQ